MQLSPPQSVSTSHYCVIGDVSIHPHAKIAPGAILQAAPQSKIVIAAGACIGMGVIIQAFQGEVSIGSNANLGAGVLVLGRSEIGDNACIGASTTIVDANIAALQVLPAGSLLGDESRPSPESSEQNNGFNNGQTASSHLPSPSPPATNSFEQSKVIGRAYVSQMLHIMFARNSSS